MKLNILVLLLVALLVGSAAATDIDAVSGGTSASGTSGDGNTADAGTSFSGGVADGNDEVTGMTTGAYDTATTASAGNTGELSAPVASAWANAAVADGSPDAHAVANVNFGTMDTAMGAQSSGTTAWAGQNTHMTAVSGDARTYANTWGANAEANAGFTGAHMDTQQLAVGDDSQPTAFVGPVASAQQNTQIVGVSGYANTFGSTTGATSAGASAAFSIGQLDTQQQAASDWGGSSGDWWSYAQQDTSVQTWNPAPNSATTRTYSTSPDGTSEVSTAARGGFVWIFPVATTTDVVAQARGQNGVQSPDDSSFATEAVDMSGAHGSIASQGNYDSWVPANAQANFNWGNLHMDAWSGETDTSASQWAYVGPYVPVTLWTQAAYPY